MTWRLHIQTASLIETSMFSIFFNCFYIMFYNPSFSCFGMETLLEPGSKLSSQVL